MAGAAGHRTSATVVRHRTGSSSARPLHRRCLPVLKVDDLLTVEEQTPLDSPIKVRLSTRTDARNQLMRQWEICSSDGDCPRIELVGLRAFGTVRQKTNVVVKTREEAASAFKMIAFGIPRSTQERKALDRFASDLSDELKRQGLRVDRDDKHHPEVVEIEGAGGTPPAHPPYEAGDVVNVPIGEFGHQSKNDDGEWDYAEELTTATVESLGSTHVLLSYREKLVWVEYDTIDSRNDRVKESRERREAIRAKRRSVDREALLALCKRHAIAEAERVWPGGTVPVEDIEFRFNDRLSYHGGFYYGRRCYKKGGTTPVIELAFCRYENRGLNCLLEIVRHEMIHAWQDFHPEGHPPDAHKHHGRDFKQWVEPMKTH